MSPSPVNDRVKPGEGSPTVHPDRALGFIHAAAFTPLTTTTPIGSRRAIRPRQYVETGFMCLMKQRLFSAFGLIERHLQLGNPPLSLIGRPYVARGSPRPEKPASAAAMAGHPGPGWDW